MTNEGRSVNGLPIYLRYLDMSSLSAFSTVKMCFHLDGGASLISSLINCYKYKSHVH